MILYFNFSFVSDGYRFKAIDISNEDELYILARRLHPEQRIAFDKVLKYCLQQVMSLAAHLPPPPPIRLIIHGGAGAGKSTVIRAISKWAEKILRKAGDHPNKPRILLAAPTGMAASLIGGTTLHSAFRFNFGDALQALSDKNIDDARVHLHLRYQLP